LHELKISFHSRGVFACSIFTGSTVALAAVGALIGEPIGLIGGALQVNDEEEQNKKNDLYFS
jgi:NaMN:DMB phosphoribosyltransferase